MEIRVMGLEISVAGLELMHCIMWIKVLGVVQRFATNDYNTFKLFLTNNKGIYKLLNCGYHC